MEYHLTELGAEVELLHRHVRAWAEAHIEQIQTARLRFDNTHAVKG